MILIAESGSTKTDWQVVSADGIEQEFSSHGINPTTQSEENIKDRQGEVLQKIADFPITKIDFYGAGCGSPVACEGLKRYLSTYFSPNIPINVGSDMLAAAVAVLQGKKGLACILGTGSNSGYFDADTIERQVPSLGYLLGDEGSGFQIGKAIVSDFLRATMPASISDLLEDRLEVKKAELLSYIYTHPYPNRYLASMVGLLAAIPDAREYLLEIVRAQLELFFKNCVLRYELSADDELGFAGSIAYIFQEVLREIAHTYGLTIGTVVRQPITVLSAMTQSQYRLSSNADAFDSNYSMHE